MDRSDFPAVHLLSSFQGWKRTTSWGTWISCEQVPHTAMTSESQKKTQTETNLKSHPWPLSSLCAATHLAPAWILIHVAHSQRRVGTCLSTAPWIRDRPVFPPALFHASPLKKKSIVEKHLRMDRGNRCSHSTIKGPWAALGSALLSEIEHLNLFSRFAHMLFFRRLTSPFTSDFRKTKYVSEP